MKFANEGHDSADISRLMSALEPSSNAVPVDAAAAYEEFRLRRPMQRAGWRPRAARPVWAGVAAACALLFVIAFAPARGWAQHVLEMLRVQQVAVVPVDMSDLSNNRGRGKLAAQFLADNIVVTMKPGEPVTVGNIAEASAAAGFAVRTLPGLETSKISVSGPIAFHMTLNRDRIEALLDAVGRRDIAVPASLDGSTLAAYIPKTVGLSYADDVELTQAPTPTVSVPKTLDMAALAEAGLQVAGMSAPEAEAFCKGVDWTSTLVIPIPQAHSSYRTVEVDGVNGTLIEVEGPKRARDSAVMVWVKGGMVYSLHATDSGRLLAAAASLN